MSTTLDSAKFTKTSPPAAVTPSNISAVREDAAKPAPARTSSAAMVVARATGRTAGTGTRHLATGLGGTVRAGWRYLRATDRIESIEPRSPSDWHHIHEVRRKRWITAGATVGGGGLVAALGGWIGMVAGMGFTAVPGLEAAATGEGAVAAVAAALYGRALQRRAGLAAAPEHAAIGAPLEGEVVTGGQALLEALAAIKVPDGSRVVAHQPGPDSTSVTVVDLPPNFTVTSLRNKVEELAGALGRDVTMVDIVKAAHANQAAIWVSAVDPFEGTRPSPLMDQRSPLDTWKDGAPVAWGKRGDVVCLPIKDSHFLIGGTTRSGKGVGMANLITAAAMDPRVNLRIIPGKVNGEFDAYAKAGVAATYFKPDPARLLALIEVLLEEMDRRNAILGRLGKSKMTPDTIMELGGIELVVIDELATYTAQGSHPDRDQLLENLMKLAAVAAGAGILLVLATQLPQVDVVPGRLAMNCLTKWAMRVDTAQQSNTILGGGSAGAGGPDASRFDPPRPGLGWLVNPFVGITDLARSFDLDQDVRGEIAMLMERAARFRESAGRLVGQWDDPVERALAERTGLSSAAGGPQRNGVPGRLLHLLDPQQAAAHEALADCVEVMAALGRDAQVEEMAVKLGIPTERLSELLRLAGAGSTVKITHPERGRVNGYRRSDLAALLERAPAA